MKPKFIKYLITLSFFIVLIGNYNISYAENPTPTSTTSGATSSVTTAGWVTATGVGSSTSTETSAASGGGSGGSAITLPENPGLPVINVDNLIKQAIQIIFAVGQVSFVIVLLIGGVMFITSAGNEQQAEKAKKLILYAVIGIVVLFSAWGIADFIINKLK